jgi:hypothetical protein
MRPSAVKLSPLRLAGAIVLFGAAVTLPMAVVFNILLLLGTVAGLLFAITAIATRLRQCFKTMLASSGHSP